MSSHKIEVVESEKSTKVCSTNWREDVILKKNMQVLDRSQKTVVNRIVVDQKILMKRYHTKLSRSKMSYARATGNMELQKRLREKTTFVLNTNLGKGDGEDDVLRKLWDNGRKTYETRVSEDKFLRKRDIGAFTCIDDDKPDNPPPPKKDTSKKPPDATVGNLRSNVSVTIAKAVVQKRPFTSMEVKEKDGPSQGILPVIHGDNKGEDKQQMENSSTNDQKRRPQTALASIGGSTEGDLQSGQTTVKRRPKTARGNLSFKSANNPHLTPKSATAKTMSRPSAPINKSMAGIGSMFDSNDFEISLLDFQRFRVHSANYEARVKKYSDNIKHLRADRSYSLDYYTAKLQDSVKWSRKAMQMEAATDATEEDIKRATGNLNIRSLTTKSLNTDSIKKLKSVSEADES